MAGVNKATVYQKKTSDLLVARRKSTAFTNRDFSWDGAETIKVTTLEDPTMGNYNSAGGDNRYGVPTEVEDTQQTWTLSRDRSWTKSMDKLAKQDTMGVRRPGKYLAQATKNVLVPEMDTYYFALLGTAAAANSRDDIVADAATSTSNVYTNFTDINADITDNEAPEEGRVAAVTATWLSIYKQSNVLDSSDLGYKDRKKGFRGMIDNTSIVVVPSSRMPANTDVIISHPDVLCAPEKLVDYTLHTNPRGVSGDVLEYRHRYDGFVDDNKVNQIGVHKTA